MPHIPEHEEESLNWIDMIVLAGETTFKINNPGITAAWNIVKPRVQQGLVNSIVPYDYKTDYMLNEQATKDAEENYQTNLPKWDQFTEKYGAQTEEELRTKMRWGFTPTHHLSAEDFKLEHVETLDSLKTARADIMNKKIERFVRGALSGEDLDYVDELTEKNKYDLDADSEFVDNLPPHVKAQAVQYNKDLTKGFQTRTDLLAKSFFRPQRYNTLKLSEDHPTTNEAASITASNTGDESGWNTNAPVWDFADPNTKQDLTKKSDASGIYGTGPKQNTLGSYWTNPSFAGTRPYERENQGVTNTEGQTYNAYADTWDLQPITNVTNKVPGLERILNYLKLYQAPQVYGRNYLEEEDEDL